VLRDHEITEAKPRTAEGAGNIKTRNKGNPDPDHRIELQPKILHNQNRKHRYARKIHTGTGLFLSTPRDALPSRVAGNFPLRHAHPNHACTRLRGFVEYRLIDFTRHFLDGDLKTVPTGSSLLQKGVGAFFCQGDVLLTLLRG
jgi:hypothetical protein